MRAFEISSGNFQNEFVDGTSTKQSVFEFQNFAQIAWLSRLEALEHVSLGVQLDNIPNTEYTLRDYFSRTQLSERAKSLVENVSTIV